MRARLGHFVRCSLVATVAATTMVATPAHAEPTCVIPRDYVAIDPWSLYICADPATGEAWASVSQEGVPLLSVVAQLRSLESFSVEAWVDNDRITAGVSRWTNEAGEDTLTLCLWVVVRPTQDPVGTCRSRVLP